MSDLFGPKISAATHGVMIAVWAAAAIIGIPCFTSYTSTDTRATAAGARVTNPSAYVSNARWLAALPAAGFFACLLLNVNPRDRALRRAKGGWRARVGGLVVWVSWAGGVRLLGARAQAEEYADWAGKGRGEGGGEAAPAAPAAVQLEAVGEGPTPAASLTLASVAAA